MPRITKVYTRRGDGGSTRLGGGQEVRKDSRRIAAYGTVDELNAHIGLAVAHLPDDELRELLTRIQNELFHLGSDLCILEEDKAKIEVPRIENRHVEQLEGDLDRFTDELGALENFILPGGGVAAAQLHVARTVCRRAERLLVTLAENEAIGPSTISYLNRLSDLLFQLARVANTRAGIRDSLWDSRA